MLPTFLSRRLVPLCVLGMLVASGTSCSTAQTDDERLLNAELAKVREQGEPVTGADLERYYQLRAGAKDTTHLWTQAAGAFDTPEFKEPNKELLSQLFLVSQVPPPGANWEQLETARSLLLKYAEPMAQLHEAASLGNAARYEVDFAEGFAAEGDATRRLLSAELMLSLEAHVKVHDRDGRSALRSLRTMLGMSHSIEGLPRLIDQLVQTSLATRAYYKFAELLPAMQLSDADLVEVMQYVARSDFDQGLYHAMIGERVSGLHAFDHPDVLREDLDPEWLRAWTRKWAAADRVCYLQHMGRLIQASHESWPDKLAMANRVRADFDKLQDQDAEPDKHKFSAALLPPQNAVFQSCARAVAMRDGLIVVLAIERYRQQHGSLPQSLENLVPNQLDRVPIDPIDGKPLRYRSDTDAYAVYSIGRNGQDDGGKDESLGGGDFALAVILAAPAQDERQSPEWTADQNVAAGLGEPFVDLQISIRPPRDLKRVDRPNPPELAERDVYSYGWAPDGAFPSVTNLSVVLTPFAQPSSSALDKTVEGMKKSVQRNLQEVQFGDVQKGTFRGGEARLGQYTANIGGEEIVAVYLLGIDEKGTFGVTAMLPKSKATAERSQELRASILTFERVD